MQRCESKLVLYKLVFGDKQWLTVMELKVADFADVVDTKVDSSWFFY